jgi:hypothetical protein
LFTVIREEERGSEMVLFLREMVPFMGEEFLFLREKFLFMGDYIVLKKSALVADNKTGHGSPAFPHGCGRHLLLSRRMT